MSNPLLSPDAVRALLLEYGFAEETATLLEAEARSVPAGFAEFCASWQKDARAAAQDARFTGLQQALAVVNAFPAMAAGHAARGVPASVTHATARDLERRLVNYRATHGEPGFDSLRWMGNHTRGALYEIGRLQYVPGAPFGFPYDIHRTADGGSVAYARAGLHVTADGWPSHSAAHWQAQRVAGCGHQVDRATGRIGREQVPREGDCILSEGDPVAAIHIPSGGKLTQEACLASMEEAQTVLARCFPERGHRAFTTVTWLLDRALEAVLPPESNILAFGRLFEVLPVRDGTGEQHLERIFGKDVDWQTVEPTSSLQRAAAAYLRAGGEFRIAGGYRLW